jgi:hypothetical protein
MNEDNDAQQKEIDKLVPYSNEPNLDLEDGEIGARNATGEQLKTTAHDDAAESVGQVQKELRKPAAKPDVATVAVPPNPEEVSDPAVAEVLANMQAEIADLRTQVAKAGGEGGVVEGGPGGYPWQYYQRPDRPDDPMSGWIVTAPGGQTVTGKRNVGAFANYVAKGMRPITRYGVAPVPSDVSGPGAEFHSMLNNGGAKEFPAGQVLALKWHIDPPITGLTFPQYEEIRGQELIFACDDCDLELYFLADDSHTARACFDHLSQTHKYPRQEAALALRDQGIPIRSGRFAAIKPSLKGLEEEE